MGHPAESKAESTMLADDDSDRAIGGGPPPTAGDGAMDDFIGYCCDLYTIWKQEQEASLCNSTANE
jgi:hypothetical protein